MILGASKPDFAIEGRDVDDQRVSVPAAHGVSLVGGEDVLGMLPAIRGNITIDVGTVVEYDHRSGSLNDLEGEGLRDPSRIPIDGALADRVVLLRQGLHLFLRRRLVQTFELRKTIGPRVEVGTLPHSRQV